MMCGPPGAGKSTYVSAHAGPDDIQIDIDAILGELSGTEQRTQERRDRHLFDAFMERNRRLAALGTETRSLKAWFIIGAPRASMRELWVQQLKPQEVVVFETPLSVCRNRIRRVPSRAETAEGMIEGAAAWWNRYERSPCDTQYVEI
jgi:predicted kinase